MTITCAASVIEIDKRNRLPCIIGAALSILGILSFIMAGMPFMAPFAFIPAAVFIGKRTMEIHAFLSGLPCESCHAPAGGCRSKSGRISLVCTNCGHVTPTDCGITHAGGSIHQIEK